MSGVFAAAADDLGACSEMVRAEAQELAEFWAAERADLLALLDGLRLDLDMIEGLSD